MQIGFLRGGHAGMAETTRHAGDRYAGEQQQRCMRVTQSMNGNDWHIHVFAMSGEHIVGRRVVDLAMYEDGFVMRKVFEQAGKLHDELPVKLYLAHGGFVFRGYETASVLVIPGFADGKRLMGEIEVIGCEAERFGETKSGFRDEQDEPIPACFGSKVKVREHGMQLELVEILHFLDAWLLAFDDDFPCRIAWDESFIDGIENGAFDLMVEIHGGLALMMLRVSVDELLVGGAVHIGES